MKKPTKVEKVMREFKSGKLHSGKGGPVVKSRKQAVAIALSEQSREKKHRESKGHGESRRAEMKHHRKGK